MAWSSSLPGSPHAVAASSERRPARSALSASRGQAVARLPSRYAGGRSRSPSSRRRRASTLAISAHPASRRIACAPSGGSQPASTRRFHSSVAYTSCWARDSGCPGWTSWPYGPVASWDNASCKPRAPREGRHPAGAHPAAGGGAGPHHRTDRPRAHPGPGSGSGTGAGEGRGSRAGPAPMRSSPRAWPRGPGPSARAAVAGPAPGPRRRSGLRARPRRPPPRRCGAAAPRRPRSGRPRPAAGPAPGGRLPDGRVGPDLLGVGVRLPHLGGAPLLCRGQQGQHRSQLVLEGGPAVVGDACRRGRPRCPCRAEPLEQVARTCHRSTTVLIDATIVARALHVARGRRSRGDSDRQEAARGGGG